MTFYESARVIIGENDLNLTRIRSLEEDTALVFHHDDGNHYRFRVEDFMTDDGDNTVYVMGTYLYSLDQLKGGGLAEQYGRGFSDLELIEGTELQAIALTEAVGFVPVISTEQFNRSKESESRCHQGSAFVDDDDDRPWKKVTTKARGNVVEPTGGRNKKRKVGRN